MGGEGPGDGARKDGAQNEGGRDAGGRGPTGLSRAARRLMGGFAAAVAVALACGFSGRVTGVRVPMWVPLAAFAVIAAATVVMSRADDELDGEEG